MNKLSVSVSPHASCALAPSLSWTVTKLDSLQLADHSLGGPKLPTVLNMWSHKIQIKANNQFPCPAYEAEEMLWDTTDIDTAF